MNYYFRADKTGSEKVFDKKLRFLPGIFLHDFQGMRRGMKNDRAREWKITEKGKEKWQEKNMKMKKRLRKKII